LIQPSVSEPGGLVTWIARLYTSRMFASPSITALRATSNGKPGAASRPSWIHEWRRR
jgi:hypothetical protein